MVDTLGRNSEVVVFVVDDDPPSRSSAATLIGARGYRVQTFESAESFLANYDGVTCGVLVTDYLMPGMDGLEFQRQLAERKADLPIILVSGFANIATAVRAMRAGAIAMLEKPYEPSQLLDAIEEATSLARRWFELRRRNAEAKGRLSSLKECERQVMEMILAGHANKTIASRLDISLRTVERRRHDILNKLGVQTIFDLADLVKDSQWSVWQIPGRGALAAADSDGLDQANSVVGAADP
ncbi:MAG: response regulator [Planctomycetota bacterium]|nr:response regulator [Planctomycetota bacterium]MDA1179943.1 response regulator [Planctomycetota bacterium]